MARPVITARLFSYATASAALLLAWGLLFALTTAFAAQSLPLQLSVVDSQGSAVSGASVRVTHVDSGTVFNVETAVDGSATLSSAPAGTYQVEVLGADGVVSVATVEQSVVNGTTQLVVSLSDTAPAAGLVAGLTAAQLAAAGGVAVGAGVGVPVIVNNTGSSSRRGDAATPMQ